MEGGATVGRADRWAYDVDTQQRQRRHVDSSARSATDPSRLRPGDHHGAQRSMGTLPPPRPLLQFEIPEGKTNPNAFKKGDAVVLPHGTVVLLTCGQPGGNGQVLYSRDNGDTWVSVSKDRGFQVDRLAYYRSACVLVDDSIFMVGDHQGFPNHYGPFGAEVVVTIFRILDEAEGEGIERLPIDGDLHPAWGTRLHAGDDTDETL